MAGDLATAVVNFVAHEVGVKPERLSTKTTLFGDLAVDGDDGAELLEAFAEKFQVDLQGLDLSNHFGPEINSLNMWSLPFQWFKYWLKNGNSPEERCELLPITIGDLIDAANRGCWRSSS